MLNLVFIIFRSHCPEMQGHSATVPPETNSGSGYCVHTAHPMDYWGKFSPNAKFKQLILTMLAHHLNLCLIDLVFENTHDFALYPSFMIVSTDIYMHFNIEIITTSFQWWVS